MLEIGEAARVKGTPSTLTAEVLGIGLETAAKNSQYKLLKLGWASKSCSGSEAKGSAFVRCYTWTSHSRLWLGVTGCFPRHFQAC